MRSKIIPTVRVVVMVGLVAAIHTGMLMAQATTRVSVDWQGQQSDRESQHPAISADGRFVAFATYARLVPRDSNERLDVFIHDRQTGSCTRVSVDSQGGEANSDSWEPAISDDGRFVAFASRASNLVPGDSNDSEDIFVHDRQTGATTRVSVSSQGDEANFGATLPAISADGRFVAFESRSSNLVPGDSNGTSDIFVHDRQTGATTRVSVDSQDGQANGESRGPGSLSDDGRFVAFQSTNFTDVLDITIAVSLYYTHRWAALETELHR